MGDESTVETQQTRVLVISAGDKVCYKPLRGEWKRAIVMETHPGDPAGEIDIAVEDAKGRGELGVVCHVPRFDGNFGWEPGWRE